MATTPSSTPWAEWAQSADEQVQRRLKIVAGKLLPASAQPPYFTGKVTYFSLPDKVHHRLVVVRGKFHQTTSQSAVRYRCFVPSAGRALVKYLEEGDQKSLDGLTESDEVNDGGDWKSAEMDDGGGFCALVYLPALTGLHEVILSCGPLSACARIMVEALPPNIPRLELAIMCASDSEEEFDAPVGESRSLSIAKIRMGILAQLFQCFTAEDMHRQGYGHLTFGLNEVDAKDEVGHDVLLPRVSVLKSHQNLEFIRDPARAQQIQTERKVEDRSGELYQAFGEAVADAQQAGAIPPRAFVAGLILDAKWEPETRAILGHAALGGGSSQSGLAIFGSHLVHAWPGCHHEIMNRMRSPARHECADDCGKTKTKGAALEISFAFLHEVGHAFGLGHTGDGIMARGYDRMAAYCKPGWYERPDGVWWSEVDAAKLARHPCFRRNSLGDHRELSSIHGKQWTFPPPPIPGEALGWSWRDLGPCVLFAPEGCSLEIIGSSGIASIELYAEPRGDVVLWSFPDPIVQRKLKTRIRSAELQEVLVEPGVQWVNDGWGFACPQKIQLKLPSTISTVLNLVASMADGSRLQVSDLVAASKPRLIDPRGGQAFRLLPCVGGSQPKMDTNTAIGSFALCFPCGAGMSGLKKIRISAGPYLNGIEFEFGSAADPGSWYQHCPPSPGSSASGVVKATFGRLVESIYEYELSDGETLDGFLLRSGSWIDGISVVTTVRALPYCGGAGGTLGLVSSHSDSEPLRGVWGSFNGHYIEALGVMT